MKDPKQIEVLREKSTYLVPIFQVTNEGLEDFSEIEIRFCKGNKADPEAFRQPGLFTETLIAAAKKYLEENNVGELENEHGTKAIGHLQSALDEIQARADERKARGVQGTYQK